MGVSSMVRRLFERMGYTVVLTRLLRGDMEPEFLELYRRCQPFTMTSIEAMYSLYKATQYVVNQRIAGDVVECGVWRGGSSMMAALTLQKLGDLGRTFYMYDTYSGMAEPTAVDVDYSGGPASDAWRAQRRGDSVNEWCLAGVEEVSANMKSTGYPMDRVRLVKGKVEETIPGTVPKDISILRLDTDWYESTAHEMNHLYSRLAPGGVLIIDDYGFWAGSRKAVDEYLAKNNIPLFLHRVDIGVRVAIKPRG